MSAAPLIVPQSDLAALTGYTRASAQVRWLRRHGWKITVNALGEPVVAMAEFNRHLVGGSASKQQAPDFSEINNYGT